MVNGRGSDNCSINLLLYYVMQHHVLVNIKAAHVRKLNLMNLLLRTAKTNNLVFHFFEKLEKEKSQLKQDYAKPVKHMHEAPKTKPLTTLLLSLFLIPCEVCPKTCRTLK